MLVYGIITISLLDKSIWR